MRLSTRIFLAYFALVGAGTVLFLYSAMDQLRPAIRQASEETMVDAANLLAELAVPHMPHGFGPDSSFVRAVERYQARVLDVEIWSMRKTAADFSLYVTDAAGRVLYHTDPTQIGRDYLTWLDVARTLQGGYGARTTPSEPDDTLSSAMYVAAPVVRQGKIIGVLTVSQPNASVQPFLDFARDQIWQRGTVILVIALLLGAAMSLWLTRSIRRLADYVEQVRDGARATPPRLSERELARLAESTESMRQEVEGKRYVEQYIHTLAHEMKAPLSAVRGATELLLESDVPQAERTRFLSNIAVESERMQRLIDRLLSLAALEKLNVLGVRERVDLAALVRDEAAAKYVQMEKRHLALDLSLPKSALHVTGDPFLLQQAVSNLLDNAIDFADEDSRIDVVVGVSGDRVRVSFTNRGAAIPDYARERVFERFYSLARPNGGRKSTGLGLSFVKEVAELHAGTIHIDNAGERVVSAELSLPRR